MFEGFTERARQVVVLAHDESRALGFNYLGTEHILLGLLREEEGLAAHVLTSLGITTQEVRVQVALIVGRGEEVTSEQIPFTPRGKKVLELALREALSLGHNYIGTEHILLGLVRENEGVAARILLGFDADAETIRSEVIRMLSGPGRRGQRAARSLSDAATRAELEMAFESALRAVRGDLLLDVVTLTKEICIDQHEFELAARFRDIERRFAGAASQRGRVAASSGGYFRSDIHDIDATVRGLTVGFTERAREVLRLAQEEARALKHTYIGTEHVLLGLLAEQEGVAARVLESLDITVEEIRKQLVRILGQGEEITRGQLPLTPRSKKVLELAQREALSIGHNDIGTEHILLGLVRENEGVAARILLDFDAGAEKVRSEVLRIVSDPGRGTQGAFSPDVEGGETDEATLARTIGELVEPIRDRTLDELLGAIARAKLSAANDGRRAVIAVAERCVLGLIACIGELGDNDQDPPAPSDDP